MIGIVGAGAFGTALALTYGRTGPALLWARDGAAAGAMETSRQTRGRLPGFALPKGLRVTNNLTDLQTAKIILLAVPMQALDAFFAEHLAALPPVPMIACCKGIDMEHGLGPTGLIARHDPERPCGILTGPSFASDIAAGLPTALTIAARDAGLVTTLQERLSTPVLRLYSTTDVSGAELGGALKNVIAIACGAAIGAGLGESARAALMTRGFAEMRRFGGQQGAALDTMNGLSGLGDLSLTCNSAQSRNFRLGQSLGEGSGWDQTQTVEGVATARALSAIAQSAGLDLPICAAVAALVDGRTDVHSAMQTLLSRPLTQE